MAASIRAQLDDERMRALIDDLREIGLRFAEEGPAPSEGPLAGKTLVLTGTLPELVARAGHRADHGRRRAGDGLGVEEHRLPVAGESPGPSSRRPSAWAWRCSTKRGCWPC